MRKNWKKGIVAAVAACAMMTAIPGVAMADDVTYDSTATAFTKYWTAASSEQLVDGEEFTFTRYFYSYDGSAYSSSATVSEGATANNSTITATTDWQTNADGDNSASDDVTYGEVLSGLTFDKPGIYVYYLKENESSNKNVVEDTDTSGNVYVVVYVEWANSSSPGSADSDGNVTTIQSAYVTTDPDSSVKSSSATFHNTAATNSDVIISNTVTGTTANTPDYFVYTVTLTGDATGPYTISYSDSTDTTYDNPTEISAPTTATDGTTQTYSVTIYLKSGQSATIENLPVGAEYTVTETGTSYEATYTISDSDTTSMSTGTATDADLTATGEVDDANDDTVAFTNNKGLATATGITANTLPFVVLGVIVVAGVVVLLVKRRRRSYEEF